MALTRLGLNQSINLASNVTGALPVANGGTALTSGFVNGGGLTEADQWRVTTNFNGSANPVSSNWERNDTNFDKIGTGMSESSGTFTFASTGIYLVQYGGVVSYNGNLRYCDYKINGSTDGFSSNTTLLGTTSTSETSQSADVYTSATCQVTYDVTNVSNNKIRFAIDSHQGGATQRCSSTYNYHYATFIRLGDT
tara:strand:- start:239 stop:823 length:585 start_codon:yes stop_codon:yes gene_type:complete